MFELKRTILINIHLFYPTYTWIGLFSRSISKRKMRLKQGSYQSEQLVQETQIDKVVFFLFHPPSASFCVMLGNKKYLILEFSVWFISTQNCS